MALKLKIIAIVLSPFIIALLLFLMIVSFSSSSNHQYFGIAVDSHDEIYLAHLGGLTVVSESGERVRELKVESPKGYSFDVIEDNIYIVAMNNSYVMDLYGNKTDRQITEEQKTAIRSRGAFHFDTDNGTEYYLSQNHVFREKNGNKTLIY